MIFFPQPSGDQKEADEKEAADASESEEEIKEIDAESDVSFASEAIGDLLDDFEIDLLSVKDFYRKKTAEEMQINFKLDADFQSIEFKDIITRLGKVMGVVANQRTESLKTAYIFGENLFLFSCR
jgi:hypothetical protein